MNLRASIISRLVFAAIEWVNRWFASRRPLEPDPHTTDLPPADRAETFTKAIPPKPKKPRRDWTSDKPWE